jgi:glycosyltransferase involved in cell wall biosynthesis
MNILLAIPKILPVSRYGGTERIIWWLGKELSASGHKVYFLANPGSSSEFATIIPYRNDVPFNRQVPADVDVLHLHYEPDEIPEKPYIITVHGNAVTSKTFDINAVFISRNHALRHHGNTYVYNGIDPEEYGSPDFGLRRYYLHFLAKAAWRLKNLRGAISISRKSGYPLRVLGGSRINIKMGIRITLDPRIRFYGMVSGTRKNILINGSKALLFPVLWHEPFGLSVIESLYFGCPVFGTPYGSLPELVPEQVGCLSESQSELIRALQHVDDYNRKTCHEYVMEKFTSGRMAVDYLKLYEKVLSGEKINSTQPFYEDNSQTRFLPFYK